LRRHASAALTVGAHTARTLLRAWLLPGVTEERECGVSLQGPKHGQVRLARCGALAQALPEEQFTGDKPSTSVIALLTAPGCSRKDVRDGTRWLTRDTLGTNPGFRGYPGPLQP
jgi:hypothetical protein